MKTSNARLLLTIFLCLCSVIALPQQREYGNFYEIVKKYRETHAGKNLHEVSGYKRQMRWEYMNAPRVYPSGNMVAPDALMKAWQSYQKTHRSGAKSFNGNWSYVGPKGIPNNGGGAGRVNCIEFDPNNSDILWVGTPDGGLWKSTDGGQSWSTNTDQLVNTGVTDIAIDPNNTNIMYLATGDGFGYDNGYEIWGGVYSSGILKSTDGGQTWNTTGINYTISQTRQIFNVSIDPSNSNTVYTGTDNGLWRSTDAGATWSLLKTGLIKDFEFMPGNPSTMYTAEVEEDAFGEEFATIYRTTDAGGSWSDITPVDAIYDDVIELAVTPANPNALYGFGDNFNFFRSTDNGTTWSYNPWISGIGFPMGWYGMALDVSPVDENIVMVGGLNLAISTNGGNSWSNVSDWQGWPTNDYSHADHRVVKFYPGSTTDIITGNDGGVFRSANAGNSWADLSEGLEIMQLYKMGGSPNNPDLVYIGAQDNGVNRLMGNNARMAMLRDGMECIVDYQDNNNVYATTQNGNFWASYDGGNTFSNVYYLPISTWNVPFEIHPTDPGIFYTGGSHLQKTNNGFASWSPLSFGAGHTSPLISIAIHKVDPDVIYFTTGSKFAGGDVGVFRTMNDGFTWANITPGLPADSAFITSVEVSDTNPLDVWVTFSGYSDGNKVFHSSDGGNNWQNISGTLPNIPTNCMAVQDDAVNSLYLGTDFGTFYRNDTMPDWIPFMDGLPNVIINELEINVLSSKIRAATYGRGVWEASLYSTSVGLEEETATALLVFPNPTRGKFTVKGLHTSEKPTITIHNMMGQLVQEIQPVGNEALLDISQQPAGNYVVRIQGERQSTVKKITLVHH